MSESHVLGPELGEFEAVEADHRNGLFVSCASGDPSSSRATWILYESNDVTLRRSRQFTDLVDTARFHLRMVEAATRSSTLLPLIARTLIMDDGTAWVTDPHVRGEIAGLDRQLLRHGVSVLPTTVVLLDPATGEIELPYGRGDGAAAPERVPVSRLLLRELAGFDVDGLAALRLARLVLRHDATQVDVVVRLLEQLIQGDHVVPELRTIDDIAAELSELGRAHHA